MNYYDDTLEGLVLGDIRNHAVSHHPSGFPFNGHDCTLYLLLCLTGRHGVHSLCQIVLLFVLVLYLGRSRPYFLYSRED
jgi:hypothetical protein